MSVMKTVEYVHGEMSTGITTTNIDWCYKICPQGQVGIVFREGTGFIETKDRSGHKKGKHKAAGDL